MLEGLHRDMRGNIFLKLPASCLLRLPVIVMKLFVSVLAGWQLHNAGNFKRLPVPVPERSNEVAVQLADELDRDLFGTYRFAFAVIRATAENLVSHCRYHAERPLVALRLTLRERVQVSDFSRCKEHR